MPKDEDILQLVSPPRCLRWRTLGAGRDTALLLGLSPVLAALGGRGESVGAPPAWQCPLGMPGPSWAGAAGCLIQGCAVLGEEGTGFDWQDSCQGIWEEGGPAGRPYLTGMFLWLL